MKIVKYFGMAVAALMMAACSSDEIASVAQLQQKGNDMIPLEIVPDVSALTRAEQITGTSLTTFTVDVTGSFVATNGTEYTNPELAVTKSGDNWIYTYNDATYTTPTAGTLYWNGAQTATFSAHTLAAGAIVNEATGQTDAIGAYASKTFDGSANPGAVSLSFSHAVSKMQFKARVQGNANDNVKVKIDIKQVAVRNMKYLSSGYAIPTSAATMGALALDGTADPATKDFFTASASNGYIQLNTTDATASTSLGSFFMLPQTVTAEDLSNTTWDDAYIAVLAQVHRVEGNNETMIFPKEGDTDDISYGWIALPMPDGFTAMAAQKSYVFTLNFSASSLGKIDRSQDPYNPNDPSDPDVTGDPDTEDGPIDPDTDNPNNPNDGFIDPDSEGNDLSTPDGFALAVTVLEVLDFDAEAEDNYEVNVPPVAPSDLLSGEFQASDYITISFSRGNLQAVFASAGTACSWQFAEHQYDYVGNVAANTSIDGNGSVSAAGTVDLFGWSTASTFFGISNSSDASAYTGDFVDWGTAKGEDWRTLSPDEWTYILSHHTNGISQVAGVKGLVIRPNGVSTAIAASYTADAWTTEEDAGSVFLPAAGNRNYNGSSWSVIDAEIIGKYRTSSEGSTLVVMTEGKMVGATVDDGTHQSNGCPVRLVKTVAVMQ